MDVEAACVGRGSDCELAMDETVGVSAGPCVANPVVRSGEVVGKWWFSISTGAGLEDSGGLRHII
jgi:hypothetical protein